MQSGKSIQQVWEQYRAKCLPEDLRPAHELYLKTIFMDGAIAAAGLTAEELAADPDRDATAMMNQIIAANQTASDALAAMGPEHMSSDSGAQEVLRKAAQ